MNMLGECEERIFLRYTCTCNCISASINKLPYLSVLQKLTDKHANCNDHGYANTEMVRVCCMALILMKMSSK